MRDSRRCFAAAAALVVAVLIASTAGAGPASDQLRGHIDRFVKVLDDRELKGEARARERRVSLRKIADEAFDFGEMAKRALGPHWTARTPAEREEFVQLFSDLLERSYLGRIDQYSGENIVYLGETADSDVAVVRTKIVARQGSEVPVDYQLLRKNGRWLVYDVKIEGVSMIANYRTQFNKIVQTSSYQDLVRRLQTKKDEADAIVKRPAQK